MTKNDGVHPIFEQALGAVKPPERSPVMTKNDGGPAFPFSYEDESRDHLGQMVEPGMSLRDAAALSALNGMLAHSTRYRPRDSDKGLHWHEAIAQEAFDIADAFLAAREESGNDKE